MKEYPWGKGTPTWTRDAALNDSDKSFTVPAGKVWWLISVEATLVASATVGNRYLQIRLQTAAGDNLNGSKLTGGIAASAAGGSYLAVGAVESTTVRGRLDTSGATTVQAVANLPADTFLVAGQVVRVWDSAGIDAAADDLTVVLHYVEYDA